MVDRLGLLDEVTRAATLSISTHEGVRKGLDAALAAALPALPLDAARRLPKPALDDLDLLLRDSLDSKAVESLAKIWEPTRKIDGDLKSGLREELSDLLRGRRSLYAPPVVSLDRARALGAKERAAFLAQLERLSPSADLKKLLASWDKHLKPAPAKRADLLTRLSALIDGASPVAAPARPKRANTKTTRKAA